MKDLVWAPLNKNTVAGSRTVWSLLPLPYTIPKLLHHNKLLNRQCLQGSLVPAVLFLVGTFQWVSVAVVVVPVSEDDIGTLVHISDDLRVLGPLV